MVPLSWSMSLPGHTALPKSVVYIRVHARCCTFCSSGQMYNDRYPAVSHRVLSLEVLCTIPRLHCPGPHPQPPDDHWSLCCLQSFAISRMSYSWSYVVRTLCRLAKGMLLNNIHWRLLHIFSQLESPPAFSVLNSIPSSGWTSVSVYLLTAILFASKFGQSVQLPKHPCAGVCGHKFPSGVVTTPRLSSNTALRLLSHHSEWELLELVCSVMALLPVSLTSMDPLPHSDLIFPPRKGWLKVLLYFMEKGTAGVGWCLVEGRPALSPVFSSSASWGPPFWGFVSCFLSVRTSVWLYLSWGNWGRHICLGSVNVSWHVHAWGLLSKCMDSLVLFIWKAELEVGTHTHTQKLIPS